MTTMKTSLTEATEADVLVEDEGTIVALTGLTQAGRDWIAANVPTESWQRMGLSIMVEPRYVEDILDGMRDDDLIIKR